MARYLPAEAAAAIAAGSRQVTSQVDIFNGTHRLLSTDDDSITIIDGSTSFDETRTVIGEWSAQILIEDDADIALIPLSANDPLSPLSGVKAVVYIGFVDPATTVPSLVQVGVFDLNEAEAEESNGGATLTVGGADPTERLDITFTAVYIIEAGLNIIDAVTALILFADPAAVFGTVTPTTYVTPFLTFDSPMTHGGAIRSMLASIGYLLRFDYQGRYTLTPRSQSGDPTWTLTEGQGTYVVSGRRKLSRDKVYNGVIIRGEAPGQASDPVEGSAWDTDPTSPTYYDPASPEASTYGPVPLIEISPYVTTEAQAIDAAAARFLGLTGLAERVTVITGLNPAMEPGDLVTFNRPRIGASGVYVIEAVGPMRYKASSMPVTMRERHL